MYVKRSKRCLKKCLLLIDPIKETYKKDLIENKIKRYHLNSNNLKWLNLHKLNYGSNPHKIARQVSRQFYDLGTTSYSMSTKWSQMTSLRNH